MRSEAGAESGKETIPISFDKTGINFSGGKGGVSNDIAKKPGICGNADNFKIGQRRSHAAYGGIPINIPDDQLGNHRIVIDADFIPLAHPGINPDMGALVRRTQMAQSAD